MKKEQTLILYFYEKEKSISLEQLWAKFPLEESGRWDKERRDYFIDRGGVKFLFHLDYADLKNSWGLEVLLDKHQFPFQINYLITNKIIPYQGPFSSEANKYVKEIHFDRSEIAVS